MTSKLPVASAHGRFQPLHNEHLEYLLAALQVADFLYIGITQFERSELRRVLGAGPHRDDAFSNPLTYFERGRLISLALDEAGIPASKFAVSPFPIEKPQTLPEFLPSDVRVLSTRVEDWNDKKVALLQAEGYQVEYLYERDPKGVSGAEIRQLILSEDSQWKTMVPASTVSYLLSIELPRRLRELRR